jgi:hypothetical protein
MTVTTVISGVSGNSTESVTLLVANKDDLVLISSDTDKAGRTTAVYALAGSDPGYPVTLTVIAETPPDPKKSRYYSFSLKTWCKSSSDVTDEVKRWPVQSNVSVVVAGDTPVTLGMISNLIDAAFSSTYSEVVTGTRNTTWLGKLLAGAPQIK